MTRLPVKVERLIERLPFCSAIAPPWAISRGAAVGDVFCKADIAQAQAAVRVENSTTDRCTASRDDEVGQADGRAVDLENASLAAATEHHRLTGRSADAEGARDVNFRLKFDRLAGEAIRENDRVALCRVGDRRAQGTWAGVMGLLTTIVLSKVRGSSR